MRVGQNPAKFIDQVTQPQRVTVAVLTYIPYLGGYFADALEVLKICLGSLWAHTDQPYDLLVFDNGSGPEAVRYLMEAREQGKIQYLALSEKNLGKGGAWNAIFGGAPGEIVAYADGDVYFRPSWLSACLEILEGFPDVGMVTGRPFRTAPEMYSATMAWAQARPDVTLETGAFTPWEVFREFDVGLGQAEAEVRARYESTSDVRLTYRGLSALAGGSHWHFVARSSVLRRFLPLAMDRPMGQVRRMDEAINHAGLLRLMTCEPYVVHMGNSGPAARELARGLTGGPPARARRDRRLIDLPPLRKALLAIHNAIFRWYYGR